MNYRPGVERHGLVRVRPTAEGGWRLFGRGRSFLLIEDYDEMFEICQVLADKLDELNGYTNGN